MTIAFFPDPPVEILTKGMSLFSWLLPMLETVTLSGWAAAISLTNAEILTTNFKKNSNDDFVNYRV